MKNKTRKMFIIMAVFLLAAIIINPIDRAIAGGYNWHVAYETMKGNKSSKGAAFIPLSTFTDFSDCKRFKKAKKVIVFFKSEENRKYKKTKAIKIKTIKKHYMSFVERKAKGICKVKYQFVNKNGKKTKKSNAVPVLALKKKATAKVRKKNGGIIISIKLHNTSNKYNVKIKRKAETTVATNKYNKSDGDYVECTKTAILSNSKGSKHPKRIVIKKGKTKTVKYYIKDEKNEIKCVRSMSFDVFASKWKFFVDYQNPEGFGRSNDEIMIISNIKANDTLLKFFKN